MSITAVPPTAETLAPLSPELAGGALWPEIPGASQAPDVASHAQALEVVLQSLAQVHTALREVGQTSHATSVAAAGQRAQAQLWQTGSALAVMGRAALEPLVAAMVRALQLAAQQPPAQAQATAATVAQACGALQAWVQAAQTVPVASTAQSAARGMAAVALFAHYRQLHALWGQDSRVHPADLWSMPPMDMDTPLLLPGLPEEVFAAPPARAALDAAVLRIIQGQDVALAAAEMRAACHYYAQAHPPRDPALRCFWHIAAGYFDALAHGCLPVDVYAKRVASRVLMAVAAMDKGEQTAWTRLQHEMLFFCAQAPAQQDPAATAVVWRAVYETWDLQHHEAAATPELAVAAMAQSGAEEERTQIGVLSLPTAAFNAYLSQAEDDSTQLLEALTAWQAHWWTPLPAEVLVCAQVLAARAAQVGFEGLSGLADQLAQVLQHMQALTYGVNQPEQAAVLLRAADEARALLHQFAAGFLPTASAEVQAQLQRILDSEVQPLEPGVAHALRSNTQLAACVGRIQAAADGLAQQLVQLQQALEDGVSATGAAPGQSAAQLPAAHLQALQAVQRQLQSEALWAQATVDAQQAQLLAWPASEAGQPMPPYAEGGASVCAKTLSGPGGGRTSRGT